MDLIKNLVIGGAITLVVGGTVFAFNQQDVVDNFAEETGYTQEQAAQYVTNVSEDELASFDSLGTDYISESEETLKLANSLDCVNYEYEWESASLSCGTAKNQLQTIARAEESLGRAYIQLNSENASESDMRSAMRCIDLLNSAYNNEISKVFFDSEVLKEIELTNSYNKSLLRSALESK